MPDSSSQPLPLRRRSGPVTATVVDAHLVTPLMRRVHLVCPDFAVRRSLAPAAWVRCHFPVDQAAGAEHAAAYPADSGPLTSLDQAGLSGPREPEPAPWPAAGDAPRSATGPWSGGNIELAGTAARAYTICEFEPAANTFALDFVLHGHGPAARWGASAQAGQTLKLSGPLGRGEVLERHRRYVLAGDTTAVPAIREWLAALPATADVVAKVWAPDEGERQDLTGPLNLTVTWFYDDEPTMADLAESGGLGPAGWRPQDPDAKFFAAGEAGLITRVRRALAAGGPIPPGNLQATPYWRRGHAGSPDGPGPDR
jgi:NADPH-dependent ferric siderophore reductase